MAASQQQDHQQKLTKRLRMTGGVFILLGLVLYFDIGGIAGALGFLENGVYRVLGGSVILVGVLDVVLVPRILQIVFDKNRME